MIRFSNTEIGYDQVLFSIENLKLDLNNLYVLVGSNGSGKSTLLRSIIKEISINNGTIEVDEISIENYSRKELASKIAFVQSRFDGVDYLTVQEYVALGRAPHTSIFGKLLEEDIQAVQTAIDKIGLKHLYNKFTSQLSDGEKQLCAIARSLAQDTSIIILDEPTAYLDYGNRKKLISCLKDLTMTENKCILFSSHDIDLCIEENLKMLVIDQKEKDLKLINPSCSKSDILQIGFGI